MEVQEYEKIFIPLPCGSYGSNDAPRKPCRSRRSNARLGGFCSIIQLPLYIICFGLTAAVDPDPEVHTIEAIEGINASRGGAKVSDPWGVLFFYGQASDKLQTDGIRHSSYLTADGDVNANGADGGRVGIYDPSEHTPRRLILLEIKVEESGDFRPVIEALGDKNNDAIVLIK